MDLFYEEKEDLINKKINMMVYFFSKQNTGSICKFNDFKQFIGIDILMDEVPINKINDELHSLDIAKTIIPTEDFSFKITFAILPKKPKKKRFSKIVADSLVYDKTKTENKVLYSQLIHSICVKLGKMDLFQKIFRSELENEFPLIKEFSIEIDDLNTYLHTKGKEVTFVDEYYILVEPGFHQKRMKEIKKTQTKNNSKTAGRPEYRNDISDSKGNFHLRRDETGRIASDNYEDFYKGE